MGGQTGDFGHLSNRGEVVGKLAGAQSLQASAIRWAADGPVGDVLQLLEKGEFARGTGNNACGRSLGSFQLGRIEECCARSILG
jgi:hypothetical protein